MLKDWPKVYRKLKSSRMRFAHDDERILFARGLAATSEERWEMHQNCMRLTGCFGWQNRRRFYQLRKRLNSRALPGLWKLWLSNKELGKGPGPLVNRKSKIVNLEGWLPDMDLNHDKQSQSLLCYRYTIGQAVAKN